MAEANATPSLEERRRQRQETRQRQTYLTFLNSVSESARLSGDEGRDRAERAASSVLCALEQRITVEESDDLNAQLPRKLQELLHRCERHEGSRPERFGLQEFLQMVADDLETNVNEAESLTRAVFEAVRVQITEGEADDVASQLPADLQALWRRPA